MTTAIRKRDIRKPVSMARIRRVAEQIADRFHPRKIILFGSHARGEARADSDVDLMVIFDRPQHSDKSLRIRKAIDYNFAIDIVVIDERRLAKRIGWHDFFLMDATEEGKVLYESSDHRMAV